MKLKYKLFLSFNSILSLLLLATWFASYGSHRVDFYRQKSIASEAQVLAATNLRAKVRNQILETLDVIFVDDSVDVENKLKKAADAVRSSFLDYEKTLEQDRELADRIQTHRTYEVEMNEVRSLQESYKAIALNLEKAINEAGKKNIKEAKQILTYTKEDLFMKDFLKKITDAIENENRDLDKGSENLARSTIMLRRVLTLFAVLAAALTAVLTLFLSKSVGARLRSLEEAAQKVSHGNYEISLPVNGSDEISLLSGTFNQMASSLKNAKIQLAQQQQIMISTSKMSALGEMAGGIAHEINNPLAIIQMRAEQLKDAAQDGEMDFPFLTESADVISKTSSRIAKIIKGLRLFSRDGTQDPFQQASVQKIVEETLDFCSEKFKNHGIPLEIVAPPTPANIECRQTQISQVILNLVNNAYDAVQSLTEKWVKIEIVEKLKYVEISVTDSGKGIPKAIRDKMMQPFFTTKDIGKGTGLGLSISRGIVESHHGKSFVDSESKNTRFVILLPKLQNDIEVIAA